MDQDVGKVRLQDVARRARVSMATASRALNHPSSVGELLSKRVRDAASELDFRPNAHAQALAGGNSKLLGLLVSEDLGNLLPPLLSTFESLAASDGHSVLIGFVGSGAHQLNQCMMRMLGRDVEGIAIILPPEQDLSATLRGFGGTIIVSLGQGPVGPGSTVLKVDYRSGMREAIQHLAALGHRNISLLDRPGQGHFSQEMLLAFRIGMAEIGLPYDPDSVRDVGFFGDAGGRTFRERMCRSSPPTAVIAANGATALSAMSVARDLGLHVPRDLSVVAFGSLRGDSQDSAMLTSIELSATNIAKAALGRLHIDSATRVDPVLNPKEMLTRLVVRGSTDFACKSAAAESLTPELAL